MKSMSIDRAFRESRMLYGLKQKPNWIGAVWGACQIKFCGNYNRVGEYLGGFCKQCSIRHREDSGLPVIVTIKRGGVKVDIPNPKIR